MIGGPRNSLSLKGYGLSEEWTGVSNKHDDPVRSSAGSEKETATMRREGAHGRKMQFSAAVEKVGLTQRIEITSAFRCIQSRIASLLIVQAGQSMRTGGRCFE